MKCSRCGKDLTGSSKCHFCGYENVDGNVREMTRSEKMMFKGVTIDADNEGQNNYQDNRDFKYSRTYINIGNSSNSYGFIEKLLRALLEGSILAKLIVAVIFLAIAAVLFFIAVPLVIILLAVAVAFFLYAKILKRFKI